MSSELPLILQIQQDCLDQNTSVSNILRKAQVAATKLEVTDFLAWIGNELNGYIGEIDDLPAYRMLTGEPKAFNPVRGWQALIIPNPDNARLLSTAAVNQSIGPMEDMLQNEREGGIYVFPYPPELKTRIIRTLSFPTDIHIEISRSQIVTIMDAVRNIILNWTLELEKSGVVGTGMSFKQEEKVQAVNVTQHFHAENIGFAGHAQDQATIKSIQNIYKTELNLRQVRNLVQQAKDEVHKLPDVIRSDAQKYLGQINDEASKAQPDHSRLRSLLNSLKTICEGAAGNLAAQGISAIIGSLLT